jgi:hypothetical protein
MHSKYCMTGLLQIRLMISVNRSITISCNFLHLFSIVHQGGTSANAQTRPSELVWPGGRCTQILTGFIYFLDCSFPVFLHYGSICNKNGSSNDISNDCLKYILLYLKSRKEQQRNFSFFSNRHFRIVVKWLVLQDDNILTWLE